MNDTTSAADRDAQKLAECVHSIPDFPKPGVLFRDVTGILDTAEGFRLAIDLIVRSLEGVDFDLVAAPESRGFIFGAALADRLGKAFVPVRKPGKLPRGTISETYQLEYGSATLQMHVDAVRPGARARDFEECLQWLVDYGAVCKVPRVSALRLPLSGYEDMSGFKLFCCDVGLLGALSALDPAVVLEESRLFTEFKGAMTEQYVAQELFRLGFAPAYWSSDTGGAKTDFSIAFKGTVLPIEVKAGENLQSKSLKYACEKFGLDRRVRASLSPFRDEGQLINIPLWAIGQIAKLA